MTWTCSGEGLLLLPPGAAAAGEADLEEAKAQLAETEAVETVETVETAEETAEAPAAEEKE